MDASALLAIVAFVCFVLAALAVIPRIPWLPVGLAFLALAHVWEQISISVR